MPEQTLADLLRGLNASLAFGGFWLVLIIGVKPVFKTVPRRTQLMMMATLMFLALTVYGSVEQALQNAPLGARTVLVIPALLWCWWAMLGKNDD